MEASFLPKIVFDFFRGYGILGSKNRKEHLYDRYQ